MEGVQLCFDLPGFYLEIGTRVRILPPNLKAGKTGRIVLNPYWMAGGYSINLAGGGKAHATREELEVLPQKRVNKCKTF
jgi:hypothetical protein